MIVRTFLNSLSHPVSPEICYAYHWTNSLSSIALKKKGTHGGSGIQSPEPEIGGGLKSSKNNSKSGGTQSQGDDKDNSSPVFSEAGIGGGLLGGRKRRDSAKSGSTY